MTLAMAAVGGLHRLPMPGARHRGDLFGIALAALRGLLNVTPGDREPHFLFGSVTYSC